MRGEEAKKIVTHRRVGFFIPAVTKSNHIEAEQYLSLHAMTRIILVRHGQTEWNRVERFRGRADIPLNETGLAQAEATGRRIAAGWRPAAVYSSPLSRALKTAMAVAGHFDLPVLTHAGLIDIDYGKWQGLTPDEARDHWPHILDAWYTTPDASHIPGGETLAAIRTRAMEALKELVDRHEGQTAVAVSHTVINRVILLGVLGLGNDRFWRLRQDTCAINCFETEGDEFTLVSMNDTCHLRS
jgi:probable phosphoglycerate mutase